jgi:AcrR family transcriptional regulator
MEVSERRLTVPAKRNSNTQQRLIRAAVRLGAAGGPAAITIGAIAHEAGVTDAAVYRHFRSKDELLSRAYAAIIDEMVADKQHLVTSDAPLAGRLREWVRLTYAYFDRSPEGYMFAALTPHVAPQADHVATKGHDELFHELFERARAAGQFRPISPALARSLFAGMVLNVPRTISEGKLPGPAGQYVEEVAAAAWRVLRPESV